VADAPTEPAPAGAARKALCWLRAALVAIATQMLATATWGQGVAVSTPAAATAPVDEARLQHLLASLRCVVCQNQSLADSHAPLALELKDRVREQLAQGLSDEQVRSDLAQRFGDFVLYQPPFKPLTWGLWLAPLALLLAGATLLARRLRKAPWQDSDTPATDPP
jgi:cytochrome c-type biogenesis protein CcmH